MDDLSGLCAVVTGASRGVGPVIAGALAAEGMHLVLAARDAERLEDVARRVSRPGVEVIPVPTDVREEKDRAVLVEAARSRFGRIDVLVNNAAIIEWKPFLEHDSEQIGDIVHTNLTAALLLARAVLPEMVARGSGHVVTMSSLEGKVGIANTATYGASKAGLLIWNAALRSELQGTGVGLTAIAPGYVTEAGMWADVGQPAPLLGGAVPPSRVAEAVVRALHRNPQEIYVRSQPTRPLLFLIALRPELGGRLLKVFGVDRQMKHLFDRPG
jgi:short-subunit dehydrogenase